MGSFTGRNRLINARDIAKALTSIEDGHSPQLPGETGRALVIGVTGAPGAGKSTFCDSLAHVLRREGKTVAILAVDPSSPYTGGAILGDRIRMQRHSGDAGVFIRSMAARGESGGLANATRNAVEYLDACGFDAVLVETVGVGQSEVEIARLAQVTVVLLVPGAGDDVQSIKAGLMEIADVMVVNKADLTGADTLLRDVKQGLALGATGHTLTEVAGHGARSDRNIGGSSGAKTLKLEFVVSESVAVAILDHVSDTYFEHYAIVAWVSEVQVLRGDQYVR